MNNLKKYSGKSDKQGVDFICDNYAMTVERLDRIALFCVVTNGTSTASYRVANNLDKDADVEQIFEEWLEKISLNGVNDPETAQMPGVVFNNHNIYGMGQPIIINNDGVLQGVSIRKNAKGVPFIVSRFSQYFPDEATQKNLTELLRSANEGVKDALAFSKEQLELFKDDKEEYSQIKATYMDDYNSVLLNQRKISALNTPHIAALSVGDNLSTDEAEIKLACQNSGFDFNKLFPNGINAAPAEIAAEEINPAQPVEKKTTSKVVAPVDEINAEVAVTA